MTTVGPLWRRVLIEKKFSIVSVVAVLAIDVVLQLFVLYPWTVRSQTYERERLDVIEKQEAVRRESEAIHKMVQAKTDAEAELDRFYRDVLPQGLAGARVESFSRLTSLAALHGLTMERRSSSPMVVERSPLRRLDISMLLQGEYHDLRRFIYDLEVGKEFLVIEEIVLRRDETVRDGEVLDLGLSTYYLSEGAGLE